MVFWQFQKKAEQGLYPSRGWSRKKIKGRMIEISSLKRKGAKLLFTF